MDNGQLFIDSEDIESSSFPGVSLGKDTLRGPQAEDLPSLSSENLFSREAEGLVSSFLEFGDFYEGEPNKKGIGKLQVRMEVDAGAYVSLLIRYDSKAEWEAVKTLAPEVKRSYYLPVIPRRCDHYRIKLAGKGDWQLYSLVRETYTGSEL